MNTISRAIILIFMAGILNPVQAHTGISHSHGFVIGFLHPWSGVDHVIVMFALGLFGRRLKEHTKIAFPASILLSMILGATLAFQGLTLPVVEMGIVVSLFSLGGLLIAKKQLNRIVIHPLFACFALYYGYVHGIEINAGENTVTSLFGLISSTTLIYAFGWFVSLSSSKNYYYVRVITGLTSFFVGALAY